MTQFVTGQESVVNTKKIGAFFSKAKTGLVSIFSDKDQPQQ